ncbi:MAG: phosphoribosylamine--glycine ligase [Candidatus Aminicenantes bacterium RBG_13_62_12]|nr:MAG: phosphoribosylamine--glycine ligase [Candidatus Aminicenantes bacterium RBG_13_62_12]
MKILLIGSGGREHALAWKIAQSPHCEKLYCAPGNPGTMTHGENVAIDPTDIMRLAEFAQEKSVDLTVVGPEIPLAMGIVDEFEKRRLRIFGPNKKAAEIEESKIFAKQFMARHKIPTARYRTASTPARAREIIKSGEFSFPLVVKADGLAAGKGVFICPVPDKADEAVHRIMVEKEFGEAGAKVLIEEFLTGKEVSFIALTDGIKVRPMVSTMDHKALLDGDQGPNTGGMGAISPSPFLDKKLFNEIVDGILIPTVTRLLEEGRKFRGVMYCGLMLTEKGPKVLEYNCRFGDPETQPQMLRLESDLVEVIADALEDNVLARDMTWSSRPAGCVVLASAGYPGPYEKKKLIQGVDEATKLSGVTVFHAGTKLEGDSLLTNGGRVLAVCASEETLADTLRRIYSGVQLISFEGMHYRKDIGAVLKDKENP